MGNNVACKVVGIGTIRIKIFDGVVRTLTDVRHIPALKKNLISLSILNFISCSFKAKGRALRGCKDALIVMKGKKNCLYILQGSTIIGSAMISSV